MAYIDVVSWRIVRLRVDLRLHLRLPRVCGIFSAPRQAARLCVLPPRRGASLYGTAHDISSFCGYARAAYASCVVAGVCAHRHGSRTRHARAASFARAARCTPRLIAFAALRCTRAPRAHVALYTIRALARTCAPLHGCLCYTCAHRLHLYATRTPARTRYLWFFASVYRHEQAWRTRNHLRRAGIERVNASRIAFATRSFARRLRALGIGAPRFFARLWIFRILSFCGTLLPSRLRDGAPAGRALSLPRCGTYRTRTRFRRHRLPGFAGTRIIAGFALVAHAGRTTRVHQNAAPRHCTARFITSTLRITSFALFTTARTVASGARLLCFTVRASFCTAHQHQTPSFRARALVCCALRARLLSFAGSFCVFAASTHRCASSLHLVFAFTSYAHFAYLSPHRIGGAHLIFALLCARGTAVSFLPHHALRHRSLHSSFILVFR